jgi:Family of unknown function (DUF5372)
VVAGSGVLPRWERPAVLAAGGLDGWLEPDAFVAMAAGRSPFRLADLVELRRLIDGLSDD